MTTEAINASIVAARQTGWINALIRAAEMQKDYKTCISHLNFLISAYTHNEYNAACHQWLYDWKQQLEKYENLQLKNIKK